MDYRILAFFQQRPNKKLSLELLVVLFKVINLESDSVLFESSVSNTALHRHGMVKSNVTIVNNEKLQA